MIFEKTSPLTEKVKQLYSPATILPVMPVQKLLDLPIYRKLVSLSESLSLSKKNIQKLYLDLFNNFAEFVQLLPVHYGRFLGSLLQEGLERASIALEVAKEKKHIQENPLLTYAVITATLFKDIGEVSARYLISIVDQKGVFLQEWLPGGHNSIPALGNYYKVRPLAAEFIDLKFSITPLLAEKILPQLGFLWLLSDRAILQMWLAFLQREFAGLEDFRLIFELIDERLLQLKREEMRLIEQPELEESQIKDLQLAEKFLDWLKDNIEKDQLAVNTENADIHWLNEGLFIDRAVFEKFIHAPSVSVLVQGLHNYLGLTKRSGWDLQFEKCFDVGGKKSRYFMRRKGTREGIILPAALMLGEKKVAGVNQNKQVANPSGFANTTLDGLSSDSKLYRSPKPRTSKG